MQDFFVALFIGLILGWLIEWLIDWRVWRPQFAALRRENAELRRQLAALTAPDHPPAAAATKAAQTSDKGN
ncbi:MAG TPA: LapA family protein [Chloroflexi bacterium]|nr:LapA family protein [Chloroflexota bacterium]